MSIQTRRSTLKKGDIIFVSYTVIRRIGSGGFGTVYIVYDSSTKTRVACKVFDESSQEDHEREASILDRLDSPHIPSYKRSGWCEKTRFYVIIMEYIDGVTLLEYVKNNGPLRLKSTLSLLSDVLEALREAHECGIVHLDLKPQNIMISTSADGNVRAVLIDFGIASPVNSPMINADEKLLGSLTWLATEVLLGSNIRAQKRMDIQAIGLIASFMLRGKYPDWHGKSLQDVRAAKIQGDTEYAPGELVAHPVRKVIEKAASPHPQARFGSIRELMDALDAIDETSACTQDMDDAKPPAPSGFGPISLVAPPPPSEAPTGPGFLRKRGVAALAIAVIALLLVAAFAVTASDRQTIDTHTPNRVTSVRQEPKPKTRVCCGDVIAEEGKEELVFDEVHYIEVDDAADEVRLVEPKAEKERADDMLHRPNPASPAKLVTQELQQPHPDPDVILFDAKKRKSFEVESLSLPVPHKWSDKQLDQDWFEQARSAQTVLFSGKHQEAIRLCHEVVEARPGLRDAKVMCYKTLAIGYKKEGEVELMCRFYKKARKADQQKNRPRLDRLFKKTCEALILKRRKKTVSLDLWPINK